MKKKLISIILALMIIFTIVLAVPGQSQASSSVTVSSPVNGTVYPLGSDITISVSSGIFFYRYIGGIMLNGAPNYIYVDIWKGNVKQYSGSLAYYSAGSVVTDTFKPKTAGTYTLKAGKSKDNNGNVSSDYAETVTFKVKKLNSTVTDATIGSNSQEEAYNIFDGNKKTKWNVQTGKGSYVIWKQKKSMKVSGYSITTANDNSLYRGRNPKSWVLYGSNKLLPKNSKKWVKIHAVKNDKKLKDVNYKTYTFNLSAKNKKKVKKYRYYKLYIKNTKGAREMQMSEFKLKGK
ncbi:MAG: hypothetical protein IJI25_00275 [Eubacterium sp.]|nr:hypothetical protein [Eubacterium sp.]